MLSDHQEPIWLDPAHRRSKWDNPESYDDHFLWGGERRGAGERFCDEARYSTALEKADPARFERHFGDIAHHGLWHKLDGADASRRLSGYLDRAVTVIAIAEGCHASAGSLHWILFFDDAHKAHPSNADQGQQPMEDATAEWLSPSPEQQASWRSWIADQSTSIQKAAEKFTPWKLFRTYEDEIVSVIGLELGPQETVIADVKILDDKRTGLPIRHRSKVLAESLAPYSPSSEAEIRALADAALSI